MRAYAKGCVAQLPITGKRTAPKPVTHRIFAIERRYTLLFEQRPDTGPWAGLWQMPTLEDDRDPDNWAETHLGLALNQLKKIGQFEHLTIPSRIQFELWRTTARPMNCAATIAVGEGFTMTWMICRWPIPSAKLFDNSPRRLIRHCPQVAWPIPSQPMSIRACHPRTHRLHRLLVD